MVERIRQGPRDGFEKGQIVELRYALDEFPLDMGKHYRILTIERVGGGHDGAWIGPADISEADAEEFDPSLQTADPPDPRYGSVYPVPLSHLRHARLH